MNPAKLIPPVALSWTGAIVTGLLLAFAFPPFENAQSVWIGLAPLLLVARYSSVRASFKWGFIAGMVFWLIDASWLLHLSQTGTNWPLAILAWLLISAYSALYFGAFAMVVSLLWSGRAEERGQRTEDRGRKTEDGRRRTEDGKESVGVEEERGRDKNTQYTTLNTQCSSEGDGCSDACPHASKSPDEDIRRYTSTNRDEARHGSLTTDREAGLRHSASSRHAAVPPANSLSSMGGSAACSERSRRASPTVGHVDNVFKNIGLVIAFPLLWVGLEYLRSTLFTGFPWNVLGVSQYRNIAMIQIAELGGVYAVSAVIVAMNTGLAMVFARFVNIYRNRRAPWRINAELATALLIFILCWAYGLSTLRRVAQEEQTQSEVRIAAIQPSIEQLKKWNAESITEIYESLLRQTECVESVPGLRLIVWPETSAPGPVLSDPDTGDFVAGLARRGVPILVGSIEMEDSPEKPAIYNSSLLFAPDGTVVERYRKRHLVPFGEYLPFDKKVDLIARMAPLGFSCTAGATSTVFRLEGTTAKFSSLICFEDTIASLASESVRNGADFLINQTNDSWFDGTAAAIQHMSHCVFRCVENRVWAVRAANTGVTCFIDSAGRVDMLRNEKGDTRFAGFKAGGVSIPSPGRELTFYARYGDLPFALPCGIVAGFVFVLALIRGKRGKREEV